jgi:hypothetical protein
MAYYADRLEMLNPRKPLKASGKVSLRRGVTDSTVLLGFFHAKDSMAVNPAQDSGLPRDFLGIVVDGPSREGFYSAPAYRLHDGKQGHAGDSHHPPHVYPDGKAHDWKLECSPTAAGGKGRITLTLDRQSVALDLKEGQQAAGAHFDRFGLVTTWVDGNAQHVYFDDPT